MQRSEALAALLFEPDCNPSEVNVTVAFNYLARKHLDALRELCAARDVLDPTHSSSVIIQIRPDRPVVRLTRWDRVRSIFAWEVIKDTGCVMVRRNKITGEERRHRYAGLGPVHDVRGEPPRGGSGVRRV